MEGDDQEPDSETEKDELLANIDAYNNRLNKCLDLAENTDNDFLDTKQQLFKAFGYDDKGALSARLRSNDYYLKKRRGGMENSPTKIDLTQTQHSPEAFKSLSSVVHIRQTWDPARKITPTSSLKSSEFSKLNKFEDSEYSSECTLTESNSQKNLKSLASSIKSTHSLSPNKKNHNPKVMQKVLEVLRDPAHKSLLEKQKRRKSSGRLDIISKAKEA